jgi:hypothetical protein
VWSSSTGAAANGKQQQQQQQQLKVEGGHGSSAVAFSATYQEEGVCVGCSQGRNINSSSGVWAGVSKH